jgi:F-type H+-transporting ATPase subunit b
MLELNKVWFLVQLANFLILLVLLNAILFKPLLQLFKEREDRTRGGFLDEVKKMNEEKEDILSQINKRLSEANEEAKKIREELRDQGIKANKQTLEFAHKEALEMSEKARMDLEAEVKKTKERLRADVEAFANEIVEKMIGV